MPPALHLQIIRTRWTKRSRGAPGAALRARVPLALPVENGVLKRGQLSIEIYDFGERDFSRPRNRRVETFDLNGELRYEHGAFALSWDGATATTRWRWTLVGAPTPKIFDERAGQIEVRPDSWAQMRWHGRFSGFDCGAWWYEQFVVNIARCDGELSVDFSGEPARRFEWLPSLR